MSIEPVPRDWTAAIGNGCLGSQRESGMCSQTSTGHPDNDQRLLRDGLSIEESQSVTNCLTDTGANSRCVSHPTRNPGHILVAQSAHTLNIQQDPQSVGELNTVNAVHTENHADSVQPA